MNPEHCGWHQPHERHTWWCLKDVCTKTCDGGEVWRYADDEEEF